VALSLYKRRALFPLYFERTRLLWEQSNDANVRKRPASCRAAEWRHWVAPLPTQLCPTLSQRDPRTLTAHSYSQKFPLSRNHAGVSFLPNTKSAGRCTTTSSTRMITSLELPRIPSPSLNAHFYSVQKALFWISNQCLGLSEFSLSLRDSHWFKFRLNLNFDPVLKFLS